MHTICHCLGFVWAYVDSRGRCCGDGHNLLRGPVALPPDAAACTWPCVDTRSVCTVCITIINTSPMQTVCRLSCCDCCIRPAISPMCWRDCWQDMWSCMDTATTLHNSYEPWALLTPIPSVTLYPTCTLLPPSPAAGGTAVLRERCTAGNNDRRAGQQLRVPSIQHPYSSRTEEQGGPAAVLKSTGPQIGPCEAGCWQCSAVATAHLVR
jgi:hypothetical protein